jgi:hypothetical protein
MKLDIADEKQTSAAAAEMDYRNAADQIQRTASSGWDQIKHRPARRSEVHNPIR